MKARPVDEIKLSSGRIIYANCGIIGLSPELEVREGYDGTVEWPPPTWNEYAKPYLTADDMRELADLMIDRWQRFKASLETQK